jgi:hypothetical protein
VKPFFEPWVGPLYRDKGFEGLRVLVVGESHYGRPEEEKPSFTRDWVERFASGTQGNRFFTVVSKLLLETPTNERLRLEQRRQLWDRLAFYNYVQSFPGSKSRVRPSRALWDAAAACLPWVINDLQPQFLLILGRDLEKQILRHLPSVSACPIPHPSSFGFKRVEWSGAVRAALTRARQGDA